jgi:hypothetical protein
MAHSPYKKTQALAMLMLGDTAGYVAEQLGIPLTTVKRWSKDTPAMWDSVLGAEGRAQVDEALSGVKEYLPLLRRR